MFEVRGHRSVLGLSVRSHKLPTLRAVRVPFLRLKRLSDGERVHVPNRITSSTGSTGAAELRLGRALLQLSFQDYLDR